MGSAYGFLAVFAAAVALRRTGLRASAGARLTDSSLLFKEQLERLSEVVVILLVAGTLFLDSWSRRAVATAAFLFLVARPLGVWVGLLGSRSPQAGCAPDECLVRGARHRFADHLDVLADRSRRRGVAGPGADPRHT
ncbi:MAG: hypothetical protein U5L11_15720 [Arhodomonas sp.]|nr:hypothetical protein [Arhodomonas sp.]